MRASGKLWLVRFAAAYLVALVALVGCSPSAPVSATGGDASASCYTAGLYSPDGYAPGLTKPGTSGNLTFVLLRADPAPPAVYNNTWLIKLTAAGGQPLADAIFPLIKTWMPLHGHPSPVAPTVTSNGDGTYSVSIYFFMPGLWQVTFNAQSATAGADSAVFTFCVGD